MKKGTPWENDEIEYLREAWLKKGMSAREIGDKLGRSRNSILGKLDRLGWKSPSTEPRIVIRSSILSKKKFAPLGPVKKRRKRKDIPQPPYDGPVKVSLFDVKDGQCRWPLTTGSNMIVCGCPCPKQRVYCDYHTWESNLEKSILVHEPETE